jgi:hypothetical protein
VVGLAQERWEAIDEVCTDSCGVEHLAHAVPELWDGGPPGGREARSVAGSIWAHDKEFVLKTVGDSTCPAELRLAAVDALLGSEEGQKDGFAIAETILRTGVDPPVLRVRLIRLLSDHFRGSSQSESVAALKGLLRELERTDPSPWVRKAVEEAGLRE